MNDSTNKPHVCGPDCKAHKHCGAHCNCSHHLAIPVIVILMAILFLLGVQGFLSAYTVSNVWPMLLGLIGIVMLLGLQCDCC